MDGLVPDQWLDGWYCTGRCRTDRARRAPVGRCSEHLSCVTLGTALLAFCP